MGLCRPLWELADKLFAFGFWKAGEVQPRGAHDLAILGASVNSLMGNRTPNFFGDPNQLPFADKILYWVTHQLKHTRKGEKMSMVKLNFTGIILGGASTV